LLNIFFHAILIKKTLIWIIKNILFLIQATLANIRELKLGVENIADPNNISDFSEALTKAFDTLETVLNVFTIN